MKILFHLGHPAHFHLFKYVIRILKEKNNNVKILIKKKDVLEKLLINEDYDYINILPSGRKNNKIGLIAGLVKQDIKLAKFCRGYKPDLLVGTSVSIGHVGKILGIPSINFNEDDAMAVPYYSYLTYPFSKVIVSPISCNNYHWNNNTIHYQGYHELAYLNPYSFKSSKRIINKYKIKKPYYVLRFASLTAHHDKNVEGINRTIAKNIINILNPYGNIYISSEREIENEFEKYRLYINPTDMHNVLASASMYIGDSQTMAAEAAVLGTPSIRFNDFVGKLGYLEELEHKYDLTYGFKTTEPDKMYDQINKLLSKKKLREHWETKKQKMLSDKIDVTSFFVWLIDNFPDSIGTIKTNPKFQNNFKYIGLK